nr:RNA-directed DNA polymerase, eukaryota [Tanacetum cinerariifolium]
MKLNRQYSAAGEEGFSIVVRKWKGVEGLVGLLNVYGSHDEYKRLELWNRLGNVLGMRDVVWCIFGDFNEVRGPEDIMNSQYNDRSTRKFNESIRECDLIDVPMGGRINGRNLMWLLKCFEKASGLRINLSKSKLYSMGVSEVEVEEMAHMLKCRLEKLPFMYLELPIRVNMNKAGFQLGFVGQMVVAISGRWRSIVGLSDEKLICVLRDLAPVMGYVDSSRWFLASDGVFSVKHIRELIDEKILRAVTYVEETSWCKFVPRKVNVFIWRLKCGRIPVRSILDHVRIDLVSTLCPYCENAVEQLTTLWFDVHLFLLFGQRFFYVGVLIALMAHRYQIYYLLIV